MSVLPSCALRESLLYSGVFDNDYGTASDTSKKNQRWNRFQSLLRFGVDVQKRFKSKHAWTKTFFKNGETKSPFSNKNGHGWTGPWFVDIISVHNGNTKHSNNAEFDWANFLAVSYVIKFDIPMQSVIVCEVRNLGIAIIHHLRSKTEENASL